MTAIVVEDLRKSYRDVEAVRGITFSVEAGLLIVASWGLAGIVLAAMFFSWEPATLSFPLS